MKADEAKSKHVDIAAEARYYVSGPLQMPGEDLSPQAVQGPLEYAGFMPMPQAIRNLLATVIHCHGHLAFELATVVAPL